MSKPVGLPNGQGSGVLLTRTYRVDLNVRQQEILKLLTFVHAAKSEHELLGRIVANGLELSLQELVGLSVGNALAAFEQAVPR